MFSRTIGIDSQKSICYQKNTCLKLFREYADVANQDQRGPYPTVAEARKKLSFMECQVPPGEIESFQKLCDAMRSASSRAVRQCATNPDNNVLTTTALNTNILKRTLIKVVQSFVQTLYGDLLQTLYCNFVHTFVQ